MTLLFNALTKYLCGVILLGALLFVPAGTLQFYNAWLFMGLLFLPMLLLGVLLYLKAPELLQKRLNSKETGKDQKTVVLAAAILFLAVFVIAGLDFRYGWSRIPRALTSVSAVIQLLSYGLYGEVMRENAYLSRTIEVQEGQEVIDTGLYGIVRHPMYTATILLFLSMPLVLGSWISFALMCLYPVVIVFRIRGEEKLLEAELKGYDEYKNKVKWRLFPFVW